MSNENKTIDAVLRGEFKEALKWWRKSEVCRLACDDCPKEGAQCAGSLDVYLQLSPLSGVQENHINQFRKWIEDGMND